MICVIVRNRAEFYEVASTGWDGEAVDRCWGNASQNYGGNTVAIEVEPTLLGAVTYCDLPYYIEYYKPQLMCTNEWRKRRSCL